MNHGIQTPEETLARWQSRMHCCQCDTSVGHICELCHDITVLQRLIAERDRLREQIIRQRVAHEDTLNTLRKELERNRRHRQNFGHAPLDEPCTHSQLHSCQGADGRYYYGLTQQQAVDVAMRAAKDDEMQNDCIRLYVVRGADGRNYYGQTLQEAAKLATERKYQFAEFAPGSGVPWQGPDGWEGRQ